MALCMLPFYSDFKNFSQILFRVNVTRTNIFWREYTTRYIVFDLPIFLHFGLKIVHNTGNLKQRIYIVHKLYSVHNLTV